MPPASGDPLRVERTPARAGVRRRSRWQLRAGLALAVSCAALVVSALPAQIAGPLSAPSRALAATPASALAVVGAARYDVQPDAGRILVTAKLTVTNHAVDTATTTYFYDQAFLAVPPEADSFTVSGGLGRSNWTISEQKPTYTLLSITFGGRLGAGKTTKLTLTFELPDAGTPLNREVRVSRTLVTFPVWPLASTGTPGSTVTVSVPPGYTVTLVRGTMTGPTTDASGSQVWTSGPIPDPLKFDVYVRADRPPVYVETKRDITVDGATASLTFRSWIDDSAWLSQMEDLYGRGVPLLAAAIGRPWPLQDPLTVQEAINAPTEGVVAGSFDPATHQIQLIYDAGPEVALHEAAHAWFNGGLLADRWANEAFASYYAQLVAGQMKVPFDPAVITPALQAVAEPLNAWAAGDAAPATGADRSAVEAYGYAASAELAGKIAAQVGPAGLQRVWAAIAEGKAPYQPPTGPVEQLSGPPDWRGLLDLLEDDGTIHVAGLWTTYVVTPDQAGMLANRTVARRAYDAALTLAGDWSLPRAIRDAMRGWQFDAAQKQLALATAVLDDRAAMAATAASIGVAVPSALRTHFEAATDLTAVKAEADADGTALAAIKAAMLARPAEIGPIDWIGLVGARPDLSLQDAVAAFDSGDPATAATSAADARSSWEAAPDAGRTRIAVMAAGLAVVLLLGLGFLVRRSRRVPA